MLTYERRSRASPEQAWTLFSRPDRWSAWAPHVRGADGLGAPEVEPGRRGHVRLLGMVPIPAEVTAKRAGASWTWRVGPLTLEHRVEPATAGCVVATRIEAPAPLEPVLAVTYGPLVGLLMGNLSRVAEASSAAT